MPTPQRRISSPRSIASASLIGTIFAPRSYCSAMTATGSLTESPRNAWRLETPGAGTWTRTARPDDPDKYFMVSADCHANEPNSYLAERIEPEYRHRIPHVEVTGDGSEWV